MTGFCAGLCLGHLARDGEEPPSLCLPTELISSLAWKALLQMLEHRCCVSQVPCWAWLSQVPEPRPGLLPSPCHQCLRQAPLTPPPPTHTLFSLLFSELPPAWLHHCDNEVSATERSGLSGAKQQARDPGDRLEQGQRLPQLALESTRCSHGATSPSVIICPTAWIPGAKA